MISIKTSLRQSKQKWPEGSYRKFGHTLVVKTVGMEAVTGIKDPRKKKRLSYDGRFLIWLGHHWDTYTIKNAFISVFLMLLIWGKLESVAKIGSK